MSQGALASGYPLLYVLFWDENARESRHAIVPQPLDQAWTKPGFCRDDALIKKSENPHASFGFGLNTCMHCCVRGFVLVPAIACIYICVCIQRLRMGAGDGMCVRSMCTRLGIGAGDESAAFTCMLLKNGLSLDHLQGAPCGRWGPHVWLSSTQCTYK